MLYSRVQSRILPLAAGMSLLITLYLYHGVYSENMLDANAPEHHDPQSPSGDVELVVASINQENTSWYGEYVSDWRKSIYVVDDPTAPLTVPRNKGREAMVYLTYMIDKYHDLPPYILFVHAERFQWHNDDPDYDGLSLLRRFQFPYLREQGYLNMRCAWAVGCPHEISPLADEAQGTDGEDVTTRQIFRQAFQELLPQYEVPHTIAVSCCAQFALTREKVQSKPKEEYLRMRQWLLDTPLDDSLTGRVFEYSWHIMFGKDTVHCPDAGDCYCKVYNICDLRCDRDQCEGMYVLPPFSTLPKGWPHVGWKGESRNFTGFL